MTPSDKTRLEEIRERAENEPELVDYVIDDRAYLLDLAERLAASDDFAPLEKVRCNSCFELMNENARLREALEFYSTRDWRSDGVYPSRDVARAALKGEKK